MLDGCFFLKQPSYQDVLNYEVEIRRYRLDFPRDVWKGDACMALDSAIGNFQVITRAMVTPVSKFDGPI